MGAEDSSRRGRRDDRYEPMPGLAELPRWAWSRLGRGGRIAAAVLLVAAVAAAIPLAAGIGESKRERAASENRARTRFEESEVRRLRAEQRPRFGRSDAAAAPAAAASPRARLAARAQVMDDLAAAIGADARRRVRAGSLEGSVKRVTCEPFPRSLAARGADRDLSERFGRYSCVAVTTEFQGGVIGHPYRARVDFATGRYALCKISGRAGPTADPRVTTPRACGG